MDRVWREAPWAAARVTRRGLHLDIETNAAARAWAERCEVQAADWRRLADEMMSLPPGTWRPTLGLSGVEVACVSVAVPDGLLLWLQASESAVSASGSPLTRADTLAEQSRLVAQAMGVGFWLREGSGRPQLWDAEMYRLYGRAADRPPPSMHEWIDQYVLPAAQAEVRARLEADSAQWVPSTVLTVAVRADDGVERKVRLWTRRYVRDGRRIAMGMHLDVSDQLRAEDLQREAERADRASREKSSFMALMSHRLRTPLNAVLGFAQLLAQDATEPLTLRQRERLARIDAAGQELLAMIDDVFELAELDAHSLPPARTPVPLGAVLAALSEALGPLARQRGIDLRVGTDGDVPGVAVAPGLVTTPSADPAPVAWNVATDRRLLGQALLHLVAHAVRRNDRGGWVQLRAEPDPQPGWMRLTLTDSAPALTASQRELMFDASPLPDNAEGHGDRLVGLDLVRQALERLGAQLDWSSAEAADAGLVVRLPLAPDETAPPMAPAARRPLSLLCVEDNPVNLMLVQELVAMRPDIRLLSATDGESGLSLARQTRPDVVLLDLHLPGISGTEVMRALRAEPATRDCKVIALSANVVPEDIREALAAGFDDYWTKPIDFDQFLAGLDRLAARA